MRKTRREIKDLIAGYFADANEQYLAETVDAEDVSAVIALEDVSAVIALLDNGDLSYIWAIAEYCEARIAAWHEEKGGL